MRRFFLPPEMRDDQTARIDGPDARHMALVLRLAEGDRVILFDGTGVEHEATIQTITSRQVLLQLGKPVTASVESPLSVTVAQGFLKERKMDSLLRPLTELGMNRWVPFFSDRTVPRPPEDRIGRRVKRWEKICAESLKQCGRSRVPQVRAPVDFASILAMVPDTDLSLFFWEQQSEGDHTLPTPQESLGSVLIVVGPEGGFTEAEAGQARAAGAHLVGMGPRILKADTAVLAAMTLVQFRYGDMG